MEFEYCDRCGEMLPTQDGSADGQEVICATCQETTAAAGAQPAPLMDSVPLTDASPTAEQAENPQFTLSGVMQADGLDLFSNETLALRKKKMVEPPKTKLRIVDESMAPEPAAPASDEGEDFLGLGQDPASTVFGASLPPHLLDPQDVPKPMPAPAQKPQGPPPKAAQATTNASGQTRWQVECLFCSAKLALPPVQKKSKLRCPRCTEFLVIEPTGKVRAPNPGSIVVPKDSSPQVDLIERGPGGSEAIRKRVESQGPAASPPSRPSGSVAVSKGSVAIAKTAPPGPAPVAPAPVNTEPNLSESSLFGSLPTTTSTPGRPANSPFGDLSTQPSSAVGTLTLDPPSRRTTSEELVAPVAPAKERDHASALLGKKDAGEFRCPSHRAPGDLTADHIVLWILVAALPTFAGLLFASGVMGPRVQQVLQVIGQSAGL